MEVGVDGCGADGGICGMQMLSKKVDTLGKAMEVEAKKMRREVTVMEKEVASMRVDKDQERRMRRLSMMKEPVNSSQRLSLSGRYGGGRRVGVLWCWVADGEGCDWVEGTC